LDLLGNDLDGRADEDELAAVEAGFVEIAHAAADLGRIAQRLVEISQHEERRPVVGDDEVERPARAEHLRARRRAVLPAHALRETPGPERHRRRERGAGHIAQERRDALLLGRPDVDQRPARSDDLAQRVECVARARRLSHLAPAVASVPPSFAPPPPGVNSGPPRGVACPRIVLVPSVMATPLRQPSTTSAAPNASDFLELYAFERPAPPLPVDAFIDELKGLVRAHPVE